MLTRWIRWMGLGLVVVACSSKGSNEVTPGVGAGAIEQACEHDATTYCSKSVACSAFSFQSFWGDMDTCRARDRLWCTGALAVTDTGYTPDFIVACADAVNAQSCDDFNAGVVPDVCKPRPGTHAEGTACSNGAQCQTFFCKIPAGSSCGVCTAKTPIGGACATTSECVAGSRCRVQKCVPEVAEGAMCGGGVAVCAIPNTCLNSTCVKPLPVGAACDPGLDACDYGTFGAICDPQSNTCKALVKLAQPGQPCGTIDGVQTDCAAFGTCQYTTPDALTGTCRAPAADGTPCDDMSSFCLWPAACTDGVCKVPGASSSACPG
jgi:hypothetical protein